MTFVPSYSAFIYEYDEFIWIKHIEWLAQKADINKVLVERCECQA